MSGLPEVLQSVAWNAVNALCSVRSYLQSIHNANAPLERGIQNAAARASFQV